MVLRNGKKESANDVYRETVSIVTTHGYQDQWIRDAFLLRLFQGNPLYNATQVVLVEPYALAMDLLMIFCQQMWQKDQGACITTLNLVLKVE